MNIFRRRLMQAAILLQVGIAEPKAPRALGYLPWWMADGWRAMPLALLDRVVLFDAPVLADGALQSRDWAQRAVGLGRHAPLEIALTLLNEGEFERLFANAAVSERLHAQCVRLLQEPYIAGLHLDFEAYSAVSPRAVAGFRAWLERLAERAEGAGKVISAFFPASDSFAAFDAASARRIAWWVAQLYDAHCAVGAALRLGMVVRFGSSRGARAREGAPAHVCRDAELAHAERPSCGERAHEAPRPASRPGAHAVLRLSSRRALGAGLVRGHGQSRAQARARARRRLRRARVLPAGIRPRRDRRTFAALVALDADLEDDAQLALSRRHIGQHDGIAVIVQLLEPRRQRRRLEARLAGARRNQHQLKRGHRSRGIDRHAQPPRFLAR